jgi:hypothetical protein
MHSQFSLTLELSKLIPKPNYLVQVARAIQKSGSDFIAAEDLVVTFLDVTSYPNYSKIHYNTLHQKCEITLTVKKTNDEIKELINTMTPKEITEWYQHAVEKASVLDIKLQGINKFINGIKSSVKLPFFDIKTKNPPPKTKHRFIVTAIITQQSYVLQTRATSTTFTVCQNDLSHNSRQYNSSTAASMAIMLQIASGIPDTKNMQKNTTQKNATVQQFNAQTAKTRMKHGIMSAQHGSLRIIDLNNHGIAAPTDSLSNILLLSLSFSLLGLDHPRLLKYFNTEHPKTKNMGQVVYSLLLRQENPSRTKSRIAQTPVIDTPLRVRPEKRV